MKNKQTVHFFYALLFLLLTFIIYLIYSPGLNGAFLLDDLGNLRGMAELEGGTLRDWVAFIFGGIGSLGRPFSLLTFALQYQSWPDIVSLKLFNYALHIVNFALVLFLLIATVRRVKPNWARDNPILLVALGVGLSFFWASAPIHTTAVQYVIQRMTLLAAFWMLLGLNVWVLLLARMENAQNPRKVFFGAALAVLICTTFGVLSKENAILLPLLCLLYLFIDNSVFQRLRAFRVPLILFMMSPVIALMIVMIIDFDGYFITGFNFRDFNSYERMLTQFEIVPGYIFKFFYPVGQDFILFYENYPVVRDFLESWVVIVSCIAFTVLHFFAWRFRARFPLFFLGAFFYTVGQLLESSFLSLELYFEHRNYFPSIGLLFVVLEGLIRIPQKIQLPVVLSVFAVLGSVNAFITFQESKIWGRPLQQAIIWYQNNPTSNRAHGHLAVELIAGGHSKKASEFYAQTVDQFENDITKPLLWLEVQCTQGEDFGDIKIRRFLLEYARESEYFKEAKNIIGAILRKSESGQCSGKIIQDLEDTVDALITNDNFRRDRIDLLISMAKINFYQGELGKAYEFMTIANESSDRVDVKLSLAQIEITRQNFDSARDYLVKAEAQCAKARSVKCLHLREDFESVTKSLSSQEHAND
ncbi:tetratricopeptide repeat protein [Marinobacter sp. F3R11]|uniref:tetratricopeptide repeat protein n=1 Tax=Marinobacter sp. F3R11 TaxID=2267231 RepID=UPI000DE93B03|nr:hypothetical protein [Marinobacter sp. F3R11]RBW48283.1 hypothetical protein DS878_08750 [Marinobacter sp. F3R11]